MGGANRLGRGARLCQNLSQATVSLRRSTIGEITLSHEGPAEVWITRRKMPMVQGADSPVAHEIAHFCMHRSTDRDEFIDSKSTMNRSDSYWNRYRYESEANRFAAELLMPQQRIESLGRRVIDAYKAQHNAEKMPLSRFIDVMAAKFRASNPAMEFRLRRVGIGI
jgi:hypothetical protein